MSLTGTSEELRSLKNKVADPEEELRNADKARAALLKMNDDLQAKVRYYKSEVGILKRAVQVMCKTEED